MSMIDNDDQVAVEEWKSTPAESITTGLVAILDEVVQLRQEVGRLTAKVDAFEAEARPVLESMKGTAEKLANGGLMGLFK